MEIHRIDQRMTSHILSSDHATTDSSSSDHPPPPPTRWHPDIASDNSSSAPCVRLMCSFGGRILPRPHDNQLRYVGGDTRIVALHRHSSFSSLLSKLSKLTSIASDEVTIKYQLPNEDLDALISVSSDEDVDNMMEEYDRLVQSHGNSPNSRTTRLRLFLFPSDNEERGGFGSILSGTGASKHESWFVDALNGRTLERGRSEASSILSEVPDYLFGLDNNYDEPLTKLPKSNVSVSDPGSPAPPVSSPHYGSASSVPSVEIKSEIVNDPDVHMTGGGPGGPGGGGYVPNNPVWQYVTEPYPVYYMPGPVQGGSLPVRPVPMAMPYARPVPVGYRPVYVGGPQQVGQPGIGGGYEYPVGMEAYHDQMQPMGGLTRNNSNSNASNPGVIPMMYRPPPPPMGVVPGAGELPGVAGSEMRIGRASQ